MYINGNAVPSYGTGEDLAPLAGSFKTSAPLYLGSRGKQFFDAGAAAGFRLLDQWADEQDAELLFSEDRALQSEPRWSPKIRPIESELGPG